MSFIDDSIAQIESSLISRLLAYKDDEACNESPEAVQAIINNIEAGYLRSLAKRLFADTIVTSFVTLVLGWGLVGLAIYLLGFTSLPLPVKTVLAAIPAFEAGSILLPLSGWPGIFRVLYLLIVRVMPVWGGSTKTQKATITLAMVLCAQDGGYAFTPIVGLLTYGRSEIGDLSGYLNWWRTNRKKKGK